ncbi:LacI family DNA-binding transcriptional regulator [Martelella endophytica]|uniref:HTH lacI-type domain-containing protein n=1 Tax=Martelella endophytica TaxID=1486262 RepID=A0A0D5LXG9_MAREN|nr:LacI family DNA-binding transcriptional regulator [Martelella endophytica]AJY48148.1 hypothetical protein TM49_11560 [Martelella endophytica]
MESSGPTLKDIARAAGVSPRTVSNVVNGYVHVSEGVRKRVMAECERLGYRPNRAARQLRTGRSDMIALIVPDIRQPYFAALAGAVIEAAHARDVGVFIESTGGSLKGERAAVERVLTLGHFDGLLMTLNQLAPTEAAAMAKVSCVFMGPTAVPDNLVHIGIDNVEAARLATGHLLDQGCRHVAAVGVTILQTGASESRLKGFLAAHRERGLEPGPQISVEQFSREAGVEATRALVSGAERPDGIFAFSDLLALGALHAIREAGLDCPRDIAVIGYDNIEEGRFAIPPLSTIGADLNELAEESLAAISAKTPESRALAMRIVARGSTARG